jgi:hypothetical protein
VPPKKKKKSIVFRGTFLDHTSYFTPTMEAVLSIESRSEIAGIALMHFRGDGGSKVLF